MVTDVFSRFSAVKSHNWRTVCFARCAMILTRWSSFLRPHWKQWKRERGSTQPRNMMSVEKWSPDFWWLSGETQRHCTKRKGCGCGETNLIDRNKMEENGTRITCLQQACLEGMNPWVYYQLTTELTLPTSWMHLMCKAHLWQVSRLFSKGLCHGSCHGILLGIFTFTHRPSTVKVRLPQQNVW